MTLTQVQQQAEAIGALFPLSLASEGSCQIGGNLATNAGGMQVLSYGNTRDTGAGAGGRAAGRRGVERPENACARTTPATI